MHLSLLAPPGCYSKPIVSNHTENLSGADLLIILGSWGLMQRMHQTALKLQQQLLELFKVKEDKAVLKWSQVGFGFSKDIRISAFRASASF